MEPEEENQYLKNLTLLCVEDSQTISLLYQSILSPLVKELLCAKDGQEGLALYKQADIIISDYHMPNMNGIEMITKIREEDKNIPIILVTAFEDAEVLREAIQIGVNNLIRKPFEVPELYASINRAVDSIVGHKFLIQEQKNQISLLEEKEKYSNYQEELSFKKELSIIRNDFYYRLSKQDSRHNVYLCDFLYKPLDTMSGDLYSARQLNNGQELYFLVDGMGKGISASVSAILFTSFVNYVVDRIVSHNKEFELPRLLKAIIKYMHQHLLEDEVIAATFILIDAQAKLGTYASFGMPSILLMDKDSKVHHFSSTNPPISTYTQKANVASINLEHMQKMLICSDGIFENNVKENTGTYADYIEEDFKASMTRQDLDVRIQSRIDIQEDDMSFIFLNQLPLQETFASISIQAKLHEVENLNPWYEEKLSELTQNIAKITKASLSFTELLMNAYEHGSLSISGETKHSLMENDTYFEHLSNLQEETTKEINVSLFTIKNSIDETYLLTHIEDNGEGFDTQIFSEIFCFHKSYNRRGVFIAKQASLGIYYNYEGNGVYFLIKL